MTGNLRLEPRYDADRIAARVEELAFLLDRQFASEPPALVSILKGSSFLLADLARKMSVPLSCEYISVSRQADPDEILRIDFATEFPIASRPVVLLKDVVNSGVIETYLLTHLAAAGASAITLVAIVDKVSERKTELAVDFALFSADRGRFAGYGMEAGGRWAHLPYIAEVYEEK
ncbi:MAG: phosphoribosyltransferase family protein [Acidobacteriota bacterium]